MSEWLLEVPASHLEKSIAKKNPPFDGSFRSGASGARGSRDAGPGVKIKIYPIKISVKNQLEGPRFDPKVKAIPISEGGTFYNNAEVIGSYPAIDEDTGKVAENVRYAKVSDPENWLTIDSETAEIKLNKRPDRESPYLVNETYFAKVLCITEDMPSKTATGTIAIQVEDLNDHCPILTSNTYIICTRENTVILNANDEDAYPNGPPFKFEIIPEGTKGQWKVEHLNDTAAILRAQESVVPGIYMVELVVKDQQGHFCPEPQKMTVQICNCEDGVMCGNNQPIKGARLGSAGIGTLVQGPLLVLLLGPLLLISCHCRRAARDLPTTNTVKVKNRAEAQQEVEELTLE
ncbi:desmoglein-2-like [Simochromis diagramma]|uniref:desmoglein-2-like n=1 Tax=Simochromis diagramma TaxID=43689 RepID=UPI001A7E75BE|nr:desmoglein-2-like [Simochromis diagramma]